MKPGILFITLLMAVPYAQADEQVRAVQEELRRRNMYFGDINGQPTPELEKATKRYQRGKGFPENGTDDRDTLRSLGLVPRSPDDAPPKELTWPQEPVLKSDAKIDVVAEAEKIAATAGVAPVSLAPENAVLKTLARKGSASVPPTATQQSERSRHISVTDQKLETDELIRFVKRYLKAVSDNDPRGELQFYADQVSYFANGKVDRRIIESSLDRYHQRWPSRCYKIGPVLSVSRISSRGEIEMTFRVRFTLKNRGQTVRGETENRVRINAATADPRITAIDEQRVRS